MEIKKYEESMIDIWDYFVEKESVNGTFLQTRRFLNYHKKGKFIDDSLMFYNEKKLIAVCPACECIIDGEKTFFSHRGSTFGGLVFSKKYYKANYVLEVIDSLKTFLLENQYETAYIKITSDIFSLESTDLLQYCFQYSGFYEYKELNTYIDFKDYKDDILENFTRRKKRSVNNCVNAGIKIKELSEDAEIEQFHYILGESIKKYNVLPVHTVDEFNDLRKNRLQGEMGFFGAFLDDRMVAGSMMFYFNECKTAHAQNIAALPEFSKLSPSTYVYYSMIEEMKKRGFDKLSWGIATENLGQVLNEGLIDSKESYGSKYSINSTYFYRVKNE